MRLKSTTLALVLAFAFAFAWAIPERVSAQNQFPTPAGTSYPVPGTAIMCFNGAGQMVPQWNAAGTWQCAGAQSGGGGGSTTGFQWTTRGTPVVMPSTTSVSQAGEPATATWAVQNVGATNGAYCRPDGTAATASDVYLSPGGGSFSFVPAGSTSLTCISPGGGTTVNVTGGTGLVSGNTGGGGGGGGGGAVTIVNGGSVALGSTTDAVASTPASAAAATSISLLKAINNNIVSAPTLGQASGGFTEKVLAGLVQVTAGQNLVSGAHQLYEAYCYNPNATETCAQVYDATTVTGTPKASYCIGGTTSGGRQVSLIGSQFTTGITVAAATTATGTTAPAAGLDCTFGWN